MSHTQIKVLLINGILCTPRKGLADALSVTKNQIISYEKVSNYSEPLTQIPKTDFNIEGREAWYDLIKSIQWSERINKKHSPKENQNEGVKIGDEDTVGYNIGDPITPQNMSVAKRLEEAVNEKLKREKLQIELDITKGTFKPIDALDRALAEISRLMLSELRNMLDNLPKEVFECKTLEETECAVDRSAEDLVKTISTAIESISLDNEGTMDE